VRRRERSSSSGDGESGESGESGGYCKPPKKHQFKKGCKPGPGRPKGSGSSLATFEKIMAEKITATVNGRRVTMTNREAVLRRLIDKALSGDMRSLTLVEKFEGMSRPEPIDAVQSAPTSRTTLEPDERRLLLEHLARLKARQPKAD